MTVSIATLKYLCLFYDPQKTSTDRNIKFLGYLDELKNEYDDPIKHFKDVARKRYIHEQITQKCCYTITL